MGRRIAIQFGPDARHHHAPREAAQHFRHRRGGDRIVAAIAGEIETKERNRAVLSGGGRGRGAKGPSRSGAAGKDDR
jgi:hypothetical protein